MRNDYRQIERAARIRRIKRGLYEFGQVFVEIGKAWVRRDELFFRFLCLGTFLIGAVFFRGDVWLFKRLNMWSYYPADGFWFRFYAYSLLALPILFYGVIMRLRKREFYRSLKDVFDIVGLKNVLGDYPNFISLEPMTGGTMKLRLTNGQFSLQEWTKRREKFEACLRIFIDEIKSEHEKGIIEITFSHEPMPTKIVIDNIFGYRDYTFLIGRDRSRSYIHDFSESPHLLGAGETGKGKSAFLRQLTTTLKLNQPEAELVMVDGKQGVEFGYLANLPYVKVVYEMNDVESALATVAGTITNRIMALKKRNIPDIKYFFQTDEFRRMTTEQKAAHPLGFRIFVIVDECAELFHFGIGHDPKLTRKIRGHISRITRLGRAVGIHAVLATQRPDKNAVDPQVKTNLTSTVCLRIHDLGGSLAVLGTGRATDLPSIPGRAILSEGGREVEIQTPFLDFKDSVKLLEKKFKVTLDSLGSHDEHEKVREDSNEKLEL